MLRLFLRVVFRICFRLKVFRPKLLPEKGPAIIMPNHVSFLDGALLYAFLPEQSTFVINREIAIRFNWALRFFRHLQIDPLNPFSLKEVIKRINGGEVVVIFPEGRITTTGGLMKIYNGVGMISLRTGAPIVPVILRGPERTPFSRLENISKSWFPKITVHVFRAVTPKVEPGKSFRQAKAECTQWLLRVLQERFFESRQEVETEDNLYNMLAQAARTHGMGRTILEDPTGKMSYRKLLMSARILGNVMKRKINGSTVGILLPNSRAAVVAIFAAASDGYMPAVLNFTIGAETLKHSLKIGNIQVLLTSKKFIEKAGLTALIEELSEETRILFMEDLLDGISWQDKAKAAWEVTFCYKSRLSRMNQVMLFTSGSESTPKGVILSHRSLLTNIHQISSVISYTAADRLLNPLPIFHSFGLTVGTLLPLLSGLYSYIYPSPLHYRVIPEIVYDKNITVLIGTPTFMHGYARVAHPVDFYSLRYALAGGEKLQPEVCQLWQDKFGIRLLEGYGATEAGPVLAVNTPFFNKRGSVGPLLPGIKSRIAPVDGIEEGGSLSVLGPNLMLGYLRDEIGFERLGDWYDTGDVVSLHPIEGVTIQARLKRFAKISGEMISLDQVEGSVDLLSPEKRHGIISKPDARKGEKLVLYTTDREMTAEKLRAFWRKQGLPMLSLPGQILIEEKLPILATGKVDYRTLIAMNENGKRKSKKRRNSSVEQVVEEISELEEIAVSEFSGDQIEEITPKNEMLPERIESVNFEEIGIESVEAISEAPELEESELESEPKEVAAFMEATESSVVFEEAEFELPVAIEAISEAPELEEYLEESELASEPEEVEAFREADELMEPEVFEDAESELSAEVEAISEAPELEEYLDESELASEPEEVEAFRKTDELMEPAVFGNAESELSAEVEAINEAPELEEYLDESELENEPEEVEVFREADELVEPEVFENAESELSAEVEAISEAPELEEYLDESELASEPEEVEAFREADELVEPAVFGDAESELSAEVEVIGETPELEEYLDESEFASEPEEVEAFRKTDELMEPAIFEDAESELSAEVEAISEAPELEEVPRKEGLLDSVIEIPEFVRVPIEEEESAEEQEEIGVLEEFLLAQQAKEAAAEKPKRRRRSTDKTSKVDKEDGQASLFD